MIVIAKPAEREPQEMGAAGSNGQPDTTRNSDAELRSLHDENAALRDRLMRALADAENTRRRAERTATDVRQYAVADFAREMLAIADNLQRTIAAAEQHGAQAPQDSLLSEGVHAIARMLAQSLERFGVRKIEAAGALFDPSLHEAMMEVDDAAQRGGTVAGVMEDGYTINDRLLRPARVAVTRGPKETSRAVQQAEPASRSGE
jgi:molecular chaperone GrpE